MRTNVFRFGMSFLMLAMLIVVALAGSPASFAATPGDIIVNEIIQNPLAVSDANGEWFEVYNTTGADIDMNGWVIRDDGSDSHIIGSPLVVPAGGYAILASNGDTGSNGGVDVDYEYGGSWFLSNSADEVILEDETGVEIDRVEYDGGPNFPDPTGASMSLIDPALDNNIGANWCEASTPFGDGDLGTPGVANDCDTTPPAVNPGDVVVNEIIQNPSAVSDSNGEWFEVYNATSTDIDIEGWTIRDDGSDVHTIANGGPLLVPASGFLVLGRNADNGTNGGVNLDYEYGTDVTLANGDDEVILEDPIGVEIDRVEYDGGPNFPDPTGASMSLIDPALDNNVGANWCEATTPFGDGDLGTPGAANDCISTGAVSLLLTEIVVTPTSGEFIEIFNPMGDVVFLADVYLTDATFAPGGNFYYNIVIGSNAGGGSFGDFHARFPATASIAPGEYQTVALNGSADFLSSYGMAPTYELYDDGFADGEQVMLEAFPGSINGQGGLTNSGEVVILYSWDGMSDLVGDLDYGLWGDKDEAVDKTGVSIDGPDPDDVPSTYLDDTIIDLQDILNAGAHASGDTWQRDDLDEGDEIKSGGNGTTGHDETSENLSDSWCEDDPSPNAASDCPTDSGLILRIFEIQGSGLTSPFEGAIVTTSGIVVADFQGGDQLNGFFIQDESGDGDVTTSDGIFIYDPGGFDVSVGDVVGVTGQVNEYYQFTELTNITNLQVDGTAAVPAPTPVSMPESTNGELEQYEGMLVSFPDMTIAQNYFLGRYGQMTLSSDGRLYTPTNQFDAGSADAIALADWNARNLLILDDGMDISNCGDNPVPVPYLGAPPPAVIRSGDLAGDLVGVLDEGKINSGGPCSDASTFARDYRLHPTLAPVFTEMNPRPLSPPDVGGSLKAASFNLLNYFTTIDGSGAICGPNHDQFCRGADTMSEYDRQLAKLVSAITILDADIVGLMELENTAGVVVLQSLVDALNAATGAGTYAFVDTGVIPQGDHVIKVGLIYQPASVTPWGAPALLDDVAEPSYNEARNRPAVAQSFEAVSNGARFTVVVNHLKSKGCNEATGADADQGDGQGCWNATRTQAVLAEVSWLASDPTGSGDADFLVLGDMNAYAMEDPMQAFVDSGFADLEDAYAYSYIFDGQSGRLDHALASPSLSSQVSGVSVWHINADEPAVINYDENFNPVGYYSPDAFRASDHDPVIVGLDLNEPPVCDGAYPSIDTLWPVNHKFVAVDVLGLIDPDDDALTINIDSIFQDEPVNGTGDGDTAPDGQGVGTSTAEVRAERDGGGNGRYYHIGFTASDQLGHSCNGEVLVGVPKSKKKPAIDDGPLFDSTVTP